GGRRRGGHLLLAEPLQRHVALDLLLDVPRRVDDLSPATDQRLEGLDVRQKAGPTGPGLPTGRRAGPAPAPDASPPAGSRAPSQWSRDARCAVHRAAQFVVVPGEHTAAAGNTERARQQQRDRRLPSAALRVGHYETTPGGRSPCHLTTPPLLPRSVPLSSSRSSPAEGCVASRRLNGRSYSGWRS